MTPSRDEKYQNWRENVFSHVLLRRFGVLSIPRSRTFKIDWLPSEVFYILSLRIKNLISKFERKIFRNFAFFLKTISVQNSNILSFSFWLGKLLWVPRAKICPQKNSNCELLNQINNLLVALRHKVQRVRPRQKVSFGNIFEIVSKGKLTMWLFLFYTWTGPLKLSFRNSISKAESGRIHSWDD